MDLKSALGRVFQAYDIRGVYPDELTPDISFRVGRALAAYLEEAMRQEAAHVAVGRDMRIGSDAIAAAVVHGLEAGGVTPVDLGRVSTDVVYFAAGAYPNDFAAAVMITASHNPPQYNGLKFVLRGACSLCANTGMNIIRDIAIARADDAPDSIPTPELETRDLTPAFVEKLHSIARGPFHPHTVVVDAGNGMAGKMVPLVTEGLPLHVVPLHFELDGTFPAHPPDPSRRENLAALQEAVRALGADLGLGFDGDADRVVLVDEEGRVVDGTLLTALLAQQLLRHQPGHKVLYDLTTGWVVEECVREAGGEPLVAPVGHSRIKERLRRADGLFAGEASGHYYYRDFYYCDSGLLTALLVLEAMAETGQPLSRLLAPLAARSHRAPAVNLELPTRQAALDAVRRLDGLTPDAEAQRVTRFGHDVRKDYEGWWFCVRPSGTEPRVLRLTVEARSPEAAAARLAELRAHLAP